MNGPARAADRPSMPIGTDIRQKSVVLSRRDPFAGKPQAVPVAATWRVVVLSTGASVPGRTRCIGSSRGRTDERLETADREAAAGESAVASNASPGGGKHVGHTGQRATSTLRIESASSGRAQVPRRCELEPESPEAAAMSRGLCVRVHRVCT